MHWIWRLALVVALYPACGVVESDPKKDSCQPKDDTDGTLPEIVCVNDGHADGPPCLQRIETQSDFETITIEGATPATKYMLPVRASPGMLPLVFQNSKRFQLHVDFLKESFPSLFGNLTPVEYLDLIYRRAQRTYYSGMIQQVDDLELGRLYGFSVWTDLTSDREQLELAEISDIYQRIRAQFKLETLVYFPTDPPAIEKAQRWIDPGFPLYLGWKSILREVYTAGTCFGRVRLYSLSELEQAIRSGTLGFQDIVVVDRVPFDIEVVVAGVVTGGRQWELSHVNVRMARRGTPNLFVQKALETFAPWEGKLVKLEAISSAIPGSNDRFTIEEVGLDEATQWWQEHRPNAGHISAVDASYRELPALSELDPSDPIPWVTRIGGKAANLALLFSFLSPEYQVPAFAIPFAFFEEFMAANRIRDQRESHPQEISLKEYVGRLIHDERMASDALYRRQILWDLRTRIEYGTEVDSGLVQKIGQRIQFVFGDLYTRVRFRSSSNVEDALEFSGAGLYSSTSVCAEDSFDGDRDGPSWCNIEQGSERSIERGLKRVWASLYNHRAWEERRWYQVDESVASMAILVSLSFPDEQANGVVFSKNPASSSDDRILVNAQHGDEPVVGNDPRIVPEMVLLAVSQASGLVERIYRTRSSPLSLPGSYVLKDDQLEELGQVIYQIERDYPLFTGEYSREQILLDLEFKVDSRGRLRFKQIRPFLDKCRKVVCNQPPPSVCQDESVLIEFRYFGRCDPQTGTCRHDRVWKECPHGCAAGACL